MWAISSLISARGSLENNFQMLQALSDHFVELKRYRKQHSSLRPFLQSPPLKPYYFGNRSCAAAVCVSTSLSILSGVLRWEEHPQLFILYQQDRFWQFQQRV